MSAYEIQEGDSSPMLRQWSAHATAAGKFYDEHTDAFLRISGDVIQSLRTIDVTRLLDLEATSMGLSSGMRVLDAGCGVCGPAIHFARTYDVTVDAVTASEVQVGLATQRIQDAGLADRVTVRRADYHHLDDELPVRSYDAVYFLESFGHSGDKALALSSAWDMLKPGGTLYIKDLFIKEAAVEAHRPIIEQNVRQIDDSYCYHVSDLYDVLRLVRRQGFILCAVKTVDIPLDEFENLTASNEFGELTGIHRIDDLASYIFPVDFFELVCRKPWYSPEKGANRYFLQNLYELQVRGIPADQL